MYSTQVLGIVFFVLIFGILMYLSFVVPKRYFPIKENPHSRSELLRSTQAAIIVNFWYRVRGSVTDVLFYENEIYISQPFFDYIQVDFNEIELSEELWFHYIEFDKYDNSYKLVISKEDYKYTQTWLDICKKNIADK